VTEEGHKRPKANANRGLNYTFALVAALDRGESQYNETQFPKHVDLKNTLSKYYKSVNYNIK
jgi:hypothetical protein